MMSNLEERAYQAYYGWMGTEWQKQRLTYKNLSEREKKAWELVVHVIRNSIKEEQGPMIQLISQNGDRDALQAPPGFEVYDDCFKELAGNFQKTVDDSKESVHQENQLFVAYLINEHGFSHLQIHDLEHPLD